MEIKLGKIIMVLAIISCCRGNVTSQRLVNGSDVKKAEIKNGVGAGHVDETGDTPTKSTPTTAANTKIKTATMNLTTTTTEPTTTTTTETFTTTTAETTTTATTTPTTITLTTTTKTPYPTPSPPPAPHCSWSWRDFTVGLFSGITLSLAVTVIAYAIYRCTSQRSWQGFVPIYSNYKYETFTS